MRADIGYPYLKPTTADLPDFIQALQRAEAWPHPVSAVELMETHISWVFLTGKYAYKIKKPVDFGFLDFSSLTKRLHFCREEVRLNRRLAPQIYLDVVPLCGRPERPQIGGDGEVFEYAVRMRQFEVRQGFDHLLESGRLTAAHMDKTAAMLAQFQAGAEIAGPGSLYGTTTAVLEPIEENFLQIGQYLQSLDSASPLHSQLVYLKQWSLARFHELESVISERHDRGFIREGHGDLHLRNIVDWNDQVIPFDCIEFNPNLRWIDVLSELAFLLMDLDDHQQEHLSRRLLNAWLEHTGDYAGLQLLRFYQVYRAIVRAKVAGLRLLQSENERATEERDFSNYLALATGFTRVQPARLIITHGLSGSGKTWLSQRLLEAAPFIRLRSDVERKRLFGLKQTDRYGAEESGIYLPAASEKTYAHLLDTAAKILNWGYSVVVDAAFLKFRQRELFAQLARQMQLPFSIVHCEVDEAVSRQRLLQRKRANNDASDADIDVFEQQMLELEPLTDSEMEHRLSADPAQVLKHLSYRARPD